MSPAHLAPDASASQPSSAVDSFIARTILLRRPVESGQYTSSAFTQLLDDHGVLASIGSVGDAYHNALAESFDPSRMETTKPGLRGTQPGSLRALVGGAAVAGAETRWWSPKPCASGSAIRMPGWA